MTARWARIIVHADMDAFYASIEQLDESRLRGKPVLVGPSSDRGVVLTASYEARPYRVGSAMPMIEAKRRCPDAIVVPPRFERYRAVSKDIMGVFADFSPAVEPLSLDEAFLDMSGSEAIFGSVESIGARLKRAVYEVTGGLTVSVGISTTKYVAKVASGFDKPDGLTIVHEKDARSWLAPLPVAALWGAGRKTQKKLTAAGFSTIEDVAAADPGRLVSLFGKLGERFHALANADDSREVQVGGEPKSVSSERTFERDVHSADEIRFHFRKAADDIGRRLRKNGKVAGGVRIKLKTTRFKVRSRQKRLSKPTQTSATIHQVAVSLLPDLIEEAPFRLIGVACYDIRAGHSEAASQPELSLSEPNERQASLDRVLDQVDARFGHGTVYRAGDGVRAKPIGAAPEDDYAE